MFYLYSSEEEARSGAEFGGTGFLVVVRSRLPGLAWVFAVTNWHVAVQRGASVIRINTLDGGTDIVALEPHEWHFDPRYDIAVAPSNIDRAIHRFALIDVEDSFVMKEHLEEARIGPGDDVFMVGGFVDHDGGHVNRPSVRFGNISVMPSSIDQPYLGPADCYCVDMRSRTGYSGSPVFVYRTPGYDLEEPPATSIQNAKMLVAGAQYFGLLGIHFAQFPEKLGVIEVGAHENENNSVPLIRERTYVKGLSGMTCVLPAWTILEVLNSPKLKQARDAADAVEQARRDREGHPPEAEA